MTVPARPVPPPEPPEASSIYPLELIVRFDDALEAAEGGRTVIDGPHLIEQLHRRDIRLIDTTRERASVDERVYRNAYLDRDHWKAAFKLLDEWVVMQFGKRGQPIEDGDLWAAAEGWAP